jgi:hypothetical protein
LIGEQAKKYNISIAEARSVIGNTLNLDQRRLAANQKINELAKQFKSPLSNALDDAKKAEEVMAEAMKGGQGIDLNSNTAKGVLIAQSKLRSEILALTNKGAAEEFAIKEKYGMAEIDLGIAYAQNKALLDKQGFDVKQAYANLEISKEMELYALKQKLAQDEINMNAQKYAKMMGDTDAYFLKSIGGQKAVEDAAKTKAEFEKKTTFEQTQFGIEQGAQLFSALGAQNKKAFEAAKAFNIANAIMNTFTGATKALASYPPPFNFIAMAATVAMGMAQVAQIRSQSYSGRALGGPVMGNSPYIVGESGPELFVPQGTGSIVRNGDLGGGGGANINFNIQANDAQGFDDLLHERRGMITQFVRDAMTEQGQRSRM